MAIIVEKQGLSFIQYKVTAVQVNFPFQFPYINQEDVTVYVNSTATEAFTYINEQEIQLNTPPLVDDLVTIRRFTKNDERIVDFQAGSQLKEETLDTDSNQLFFLSQEAIDVTNFGLGVDPLNFTVDARGARIINVGAGEDPTDGANMEQLGEVEAVANQAVANAAASLAAANAAQAAAENAQSAAEAIEGIAQNAETIANNASTAVNNHINATTGAHEASAISTEPDGEMTSTDVQSLITELQAKLQKVSEKNQPDGYAGIGSDGFLPINIVPGVFKDTVSYPTVADFPVTGDVDKIYLALDTKKTYSWFGSVYGEVSPSDVNSVNGYMGAVVLDKDDIGLDQVDNTSDAAKNAAVADLTNKAIISPSRLDPKKDTKANLITYALTAQNGELVWATDDKKQFQVKDGLLVSMGGGSGQGGINYITNYNLEDDALGWNAYADAAGVEPVDGTGGSPTVTVTRSLVTPLRGLASLLYTKPASNVQGQGFSYDFTIDPSDAGKVLQGSFDYLINSGTFVDGDLTVWLYHINGGSSVQIQPAPYIIRNSTIIEKMFFEFQTNGDPSATLTYRLEVHNSTTSASAFTILADNFQIGPTAKLYGSASTDFVNRGPISIGAVTTAPTKGTTVLDQVWVAKAGGNRAALWFKYRQTTAGSAGSGDYLFQLPTGMKFDTNVIKPFTGSPWSAGSALANSFVGMGSDVNAAGSGPLMAYAYSDNQFRLIAQYGGTGAATLHYMVGSTDFSLAIANLSFEVRIDAPMLGWESTQIMSSDASTRVVVLQAAGAFAAGSANAPIIFPTVGNDTHAAYSNVTGRFTVPVAGYYRVTAYTDQATLTSGNVLYASVNGNTTPGFNRPILQQNFNSNQAIGGSGIVKANAGDLIDVRLSAAFGVGTNGVLQIERISGPSQIMASETVAASYWLSANFAASTTVPINFDSKEYDTHGMVTVSPTAWRATAPISGLYSLSLVTQSNGTIAGYTLWKNGTAYKAAGVHAANTNNMITISIRLLAGEYLDIRPTVANTILGGVLSSAATAIISITRTGNY